MKKVFMALFAVCFSLILVEHFQVSIPDTAENRAVEAQRLSNVMAQRLTASDLRIMSNTYKTPVGTVLAWVNTLIVPFCVLGIVLCFVIAFRKPKTTLQDPEDFLEKRVRVQVN